MGKQIGGSSQDGPPILRFRETVSNALYTVPERNESQSRDQML
jgi:hypothetical protein